MLKNILPVAAAAALSVFAATDMARAGESSETNLGPVGPYEPILASVGESRLLAYFVPEHGNCAVNAVMSAATPKGDGESTRVRVALHPGELFHFDGVRNERVVFTCAPGAKAMTVLNRGEIRTKSASNTLF